MQTGQATHGSARVLVARRGVKVPAFVRAKSAPWRTNAGKSGAVFAVRQKSLAGCVAANDNPNGEIWDFERWLRDGDPERHFHCVGDKSPKAIKNGVIVVMAVPYRCYLHMPYPPLGRLEDTEKFWPHEFPVVMRGSRNMRRWLHDRRYTVKDGYLFDLLERYLRRYRPTVIGSRSAREYVLTVKRRIAERWHVEGRTFFNTDCHYERRSLIDGKQVSLTGIAVVFAELADRMEFGE